MAKSGKVKVYHLMVLDESGSMDQVRDTTINGVNEQIKTIQNSADEFRDTQEHLVSLVTFSGQVNEPVLWKEPSDRLEMLTRNNYHPGGTTALRDAIWSSIRRLTSEVKREFENRQATVCVTIFTDGEENASHMCNEEQVADLVKKSEESGQWTIAFVGAGGKEVFDVAKKLNIRAANTMNYTASRDGFSDAFATMATSRALYSKSVHDAYSAPAASSTGGDPLATMRSVGFFKNVDLSGSDPIDPQKSMDPLKDADLNK